MIAFYRNLAPRERFMLVGGTVVLAIILVIFGIWQPYFNSLNRLAGKIVQKEVQLGQVLRLQQEYKDLERQIDRVERSLPAARRSAVTIVEGLITAQDLRPQLSYIRPQPVQKQGPYQQESLAVKLDNLSLRQILHLLDSMENGEVPINIIDMRLQPRFDQDARLDLTMTAAVLKKS